MNRQDQLTEIARRVRKIEHPDLTHDEALRKELGKGCICAFKKDYMQGYVTFEKGETVELIHKDTKYEHEFYHPKIRGTLELPNHIFTELEILGLPITLHRLLAALEVVFTEEEGFSVEYHQTFAQLVVAFWNSQIETTRFKCTFFSRIDNRDCTLEDQSEETLDALLSVLPE